MLRPGIWTLGRVADPSYTVQRLQRDVNRLFSGVTEPYSRDFPPINIWMDDRGAIVNTELPGMELENIAISLTGDTITIKGNRDLDPLKEGESYHRQERHYGSFSRTLQLSFPVDAAKVDAKYNKGVLTITLPRAEADKPKKISVKTE